MERKSFSFPYDIAIYILAIALGHQPRTSYFVAYLESEDAHIQDSEPTNSYEAIDLFNRLADQGYSVVLYEKRGDNFSAMSGMSKIFHENFSDKMFESRLFGPLL